jgi:hypothetical protein
MNTDIIRVEALQRIIRNVKEAVEKELGPIWKPGEEKLDTLSYQTYIELMRGIVQNLPKNFTIDNLEKL